jgi:hypothetical protein
VPLFSRRSYTRRDVTLSELVDWREPVIKNAIFEHCQIFGPVIIAPDGSTTFKDCGFAFESGPDELLWEMAPNTVKTGIIAVEGCSFRRCTFKAVGIAGGPRIIAKFRKWSATDAPR